MPCSGWPTSWTSAQCLERPPGPRANFTAVLCLAWPDGESAVFEGKVYGHLVWPPRGSQGFGYDPMFVADGHTLTFGEMEPACQACDLAPRPRLRSSSPRACLGSRAR